MQKGYFFPTLILVLTVLISCSGPKHYLIKENALNERQNNKTKATVVFIRLQSGFGGTHDVAVYDGDKLIGILSDSGYFTYETSPGEHLFASYSRTLDFLKAEIAAGKTYYVQASHQDRVLALASKIIAVKKGSDIMNELDQILPSLNNTELTELGRELYKVHNEPNGKFIIDDRAAFFTYRIDYDQARAQWLQKSKTVQKAELQPEDGL